MNDRLDTHWTIKLNWAFFFYMPVCQTTLNNYFMITSEQFKFEFLLKEKLCSTCLWNLLHWHF